MKLSVVLVSYRNQDVIKVCLNSIKKYNDLGDNVEVIIIEQSPDNSIYEFIKKNYPWAKIYKNENEGFGRGNNKGVSYASGEYYLFLNTDTILVEPVFAYAVEKFESDRKLGAFGVKLVNAQMKRNLSFGFKNPFGAIKGPITKFCNLCGIYSQKTMYISGADIFIRADLFKKIGGFDSNIFMYFEDTLLCDLVYENGYNVKYFPQKRIIHLQGGSTGNKSVISSEKFLDSYAYYMSKKGGNFLSTIIKEKRKLEMEAKLCKKIFPARAAAKKLAAEGLDNYIETRKMV